MGDGPAHGQIAGTAAAELARAWNAHDMRALASLFHDDAAFVNVNGAYAHGRHEIRTQHEAVHAGFFRNSTVVPDVRRLFVGPRRRLMAGQCLRSRALDHLADPGSLVRMTTGMVRSVLAS